MLGSVTVGGWAFVAVSRAAGSAVVAGAGLSFNPIRLILLVGWVYLCLYFVQRVHFSPLVPKSYKPMANIVTLFTGPLLLLVLFVQDTARKGRGTGQGFFPVLKQQLASLKQQVQQVISNLH